MATEEQITAAADKLNETIALKLGDLAGELLELPKAGSNEWLEQQHFEENPKAKEQALREWQLTKLAIYREAQISPSGIVINARKNGASWQQIADIYGITRQAAYDRWAKYV